MCLVSLLFKALAEPFLYKKVTLGQNEISLTSFLHTVLARPALAVYVPVLSVRWYDEPDSSTQIVIDILFAAALIRLGLTQSIGQSPWTGRPQVILLMYLLPNLQELVIDWCDAFREFGEGTLTIPIERLPAGLKSLQIFNGTGHLDAPATTHTMLLALLRLPHIRKLSLNMESAEDYTDDHHDADTNDNHDVDNLISPADNRKMSSVTNLRFVYGNLSTAMLNRILQQPRALTHFTYMDSDDFALVETTTFQTALSHLRPTLQYLHLEWIRALETPEREDDVEPRTIGSLRDWPVLRTLRCSLTALVGKPAVAKSRLVDVVPAVIRILVLDQQDDGTSFTASDQRSDMWAESDMTDMIRELLEKKRNVGFMG